MGGLLVVSDVPAVPLAFLAIFCALAAFISDTVIPFGEF